MLYMVIERFKNGDAAPIGARFRQSGRMLPEGLTYVSSWIDPRGSICFQLMETERQELFAAWTSQWNDLIDFEITPVLDSALFWLQKQSS